MKKVVFRVENGMDRNEILATTYQMRNFYSQLGSGFFTVLDIMNYIQHHNIVKMAKKGDSVLDVCCGRGLLLPMLRYYRKEIKEYVGVDIEPKNIGYLTKRVTDNKPFEEENYYSFNVTYVESNVAEMANKIDNKFDLIVYTSAIEHMHKDMGYASLEQCFKLSKNNTKLILTCPNTPEDKDGYDTQYRAHVYEWKRSELIEALTTIGFVIEEEFGLLANKTELKETLIKENILSEENFNILAKFIPSDWLIPVLAPIVPQISKEIGFICSIKHNEDNYLF